MVPHAAFSNQEHTEPLGLYLHIPFCLKKCAYCDFISFDNRPDQKEAYVRALETEISYWGKRLMGQPVDTIFIGGGTPTALSQDQLCRILDCVFEAFSVSHGYECTVECNPKTASLHYFEALFQHGVNRISLGAQSFDDRELQTLGRVHQSSDIRQAVREIRAAGIGNISLDLMYGFFGQTPQSFQRSLEEALALEPQHVSVYELILEEGTPFFERDRALLPSEEEQDEMDQIKEALLKESGYQSYEISNFSKPGFQCRHNIKYWRYAPYLGMGLASHSFLENTRFYHDSDLDAYLKAPTQSKSQPPLSRAEQMGEYFMLGLRMTDGISEKAFEARFDVTPDSVYHPVIARHQKNGLLDVCGGRIFLTPRGRALSNYVMCDFLPDSPEKAE